MKVQVDFYALLLWCAFLFIGCAEKVEQVNQDVAVGPSSTLFEKVPATESGINFTNHNQENNTLNFYTFEYFYNGGGVGIGDFNNDGLPDAYMTANMSPNKLYINKGNMQFEDITNTANVNAKESDWCTGVAIIDINNDGWQDIYVSRSGWFVDEEVSKLRNLLYINNGNLTFTESAVEYGLDGQRYSTQACFFDFDRDGDLDLYEMNHPTDFTSFVLNDLGEITEFAIEDATSDQFYINENNRFKNVTNLYGLKNRAHGLGIVTLDVNNDDWLDIYIANDYLEPDIVLVNQEGKGFENVVEDALQHMPKFSMGVDASDINRDGFQDLFVVEMLAADNYRKKTNMAPMNPEVYYSTVNSGRLYQDMHNALQINEGNGKFSETAWLSGVAETDWSWCPLFADLDNNGEVDLFVTNGYKRDVLDKDFHKTADDIGTENLKFDELQHLIPSQKIPNYSFTYSSNLSFTNTSDVWGLGDAIQSNGAAYADFDNDGDLDLLLNNMNEIATLYRNKGNQSNYSRIELKNGSVIPYGAKAEILDKGFYQMKQLASVRGYLSNSEPILHFGLGERNAIDSMLVTWADGKRSLYTNISINKVSSFNYKDANFMEWEVENSLPLLSSSKSNFGLNFTHSETPYDDYAREVLLPHKLSQEGPYMSVGDVNGDGTEDVFIGNGSGFAGALYLQKDGKFERSEQAAFEADKLAEDLGNELFDADGDGDLDLYVVSGSNELSLESEWMQDRLYLNDGKGKFTKAPDALPKMPASGSCVKAIDFDEDGDLDLYVGGYQVPGLYPQAGTSYLLKNEGGKFTDASMEWSKGLQAVGMVKDAVWVDVNNDGKQDLVVVGHWMPVSVFLNEDGVLENRTADYGLENSVGWWNCVNLTDIDGNGYMDFVAGNLGLNSKNKASSEEPFEIYASDFDGNGTNDIVLGYYNNGICYPVRGLQCSSEQVPSIKKKIPSYRDFGMANLETVYGTDALNEAIHYEVQTFASCRFINNDGVAFKREELPIEAQLAPIDAFIVNDFNLDGREDLFLVGNQYQVEVETGKYDASGGELLINNDGSNYTTHQTGTQLYADNSAAKLVKMNGEVILFVAQNNGTLQCLKWM